MSWIYKRIRAVNYEPLNKFSMKPVMFNLSYQSILALNLFYTTIKLRSVVIKIISNKTKNFIV